MAYLKDNPDSTIFLTKSNITPTDNETTVKAETEKQKEGNNSLNNHLSNSGIFFQLDENNL